MKIAAKKASLICSSHFANNHLLVCVNFVCSKLLNLWFLYSFLLQCCAFFRNFWFVFQTCTVPLNQILKIVYRQSTSWYFKDISPKFYSNLATSPRNKIWNLNWVGSTSCHLGGQCSSLPYGLFHMNLQKQEVYFFLLFLHKCGILLLTFKKRAAIRLLRRFLNIKNCRTKQHCF